MPLNDTHRNDAVVFPASSSFFARCLRPVHHRLVLGDLLQHRLDALHLQGAALFHRSEQLAQLRVERQPIMLVLDRQPPALLQREGNRLKYGRKLLDRRRLRPVISAGAAPVGTLVAQLFRPLKSDLVLAIFAGDREKLLRSARSKISDPRPAWKAAPAGPALRPGI